MQKVFENIIAKLGIRAEKSEKKEMDAEYFDDSKLYKGERIAFGDAIEIVKQAAEEYNNAIIDGKYCFQTCACTEKCDKFSRLCNGDTDWYENIDDWQENCNGDWIPCSERLPKYGEVVMCCCENGGITVSCITHKCVKLSKIVCFGQHRVIAWQPLPTPYHQKGEMNG